MITSATPSLHREALRSAGFSIGAFILANLAGELVRPPFDTTGDWISLPDPPWLRHTLGALLAAVLLANPLLAARPPLFRRVGAILTGTVVVVALADAVAFYLALARGRIHTPAVLPASLLVAALFAALFADIFLPAPPAPRAPRASEPIGSDPITSVSRASDPLPAPPTLSPRPPRDPRRALVRLAAAGALILSLPVVRMITFGPTRYERRADCAVVFGARVWNDGTPSDALADRVDESIRLYQAGRVRHLVMSGGIDRRNGHSEPEVMRARAEAAGVPRAAILLDEQGVDTASTVRNVARLLAEQSLRSALVVTHYYHEPRAKMLFDRAGVRAWTVPATMKRRLLKEPYFILREIAAFYHSFLLE